MNDPDFKANLKAYYNTQNRNKHLKFPDLFAQQRMSSNKWKTKLFLYFLRFEPKSWAISKGDNPYISRSLTPNNRKIAEIGEKNIQFQENYRKNPLGKEKNKNGRKFERQPFPHKQRKYKLYETSKICETFRSKSSNFREGEAIFDSFISIIKSCEEALIENEEEKKLIRNFILEGEQQTHKIKEKQNNFNENLFKEFMDIEAQLVKKDQEETILQRKKSEEQLISWLKGENRLNRFQYMKYEKEIHSIKKYKRKHNFKKLAVDIRNLN